MVTKLYTMNPKACSVVELYGILDPITRDWTDGLLSNIFREINKPTEKKEKKYILFDGDVDALWVENMNSVMDDNKLLTLANGERIRLQKHCALLMEVKKTYRIFIWELLIILWQVGDLQYASPSTVSRCGMVYVDPKNLGYQPYWERWVNDIPSDNNKAEFNKLFEKYVPPCISLILDGIQDGRQTERLKCIMPLSNLNMVVNSLYNPNLPYCVHITGLTAVYGPGFLVASRRTRRCEGEEWRLGPKLRGSRVLLSHISLLVTGSCSRGRE